MPRSDVGTVGLPCYNSGSETLDGLSRPVLVLHRDGVTHHLSRSNSPYVNSQPASRMKGGCARIEILSRMFSWDERSHCLSSHISPEWGLHLPQLLSSSSVFPCCRLYSFRAFSGWKVVWILSFWKFLDSGWSMVTLEVKLIRGKFEEESCPYWKWKVGLVYADYKGLKGYEIQSQRISSLYSCQTVSTSSPLPSSHIYVSPSSLGTGKLGNWGISWETTPLLGFSGFYTKEKSRKDFNRKIERRNSLSSVNIILLDGHSCL